MDTVEEIPAYDGTQDCKNCGRKGSEKPMVFRNDPWCSDSCEKALIAVSGHI